MKKVIKRIVKQSVFIPAASVFVAVAVFAGTSVLVTGCKKKTETVTDTLYKTTVKGCTDPSAMNYNSSATQDDGSCVYSQDLDDTTRSWVLDKHHSNIGWEADYKAEGFSLLTGRFDNFMMYITFNEKEPSKDNIRAWVQLSTQNTSEPGRDGAGDCGPTYLGVQWTDTLADGSTDPASVVASTDTAWYQSTNVSMFFGKTGQVTYKATGNLTFKGVTKPVDLYFTYSGIEYDASSTGTTAVTGFTGYFYFNCQSDFGVTSTSVGDQIKVLCNAHCKTPTIVN